MGLIAILINIFIGTRILFKKSGEIDSNSCPKCGKDAYIGSGRIFFHIFFIPLIPIGKYPVLYKCTSCRKKFEWFLYWNKSSDRQENAIVDATPYIGPSMNKLFDVIRESKPFLIVTPDDNLDKFIKPFCSSDEYNIENNLLSLINDETCVQYSKDVLVHTFGEGDYKTVEKRFRELINIKLNNWHSI